MAYQRPFLISLKRNSSQEPWGFRTFGGKEYAEPHIVEKVAPDSVAERAGVREGDEIIQIGRFNIQDSTFGQVQELIARSGNKIEMFVIREDLLTPRKGKEPSHVKAVVHNPYNSPLNLYSTENIAETLAKQAEVLTEGHVSSAEEDDAPENLSFKQKSAVFQLLEEQAKQDSINQYHSRQRKAPPPPKAPPTGPQYYQNKENYSPQDQAYNAVQTSPQQYTTSFSSPAEYRREEKVVNYSVKSEQNISSATTGSYITDQQQASEYRTTHKVTPTPPVRSSQQTVHTASTAAYIQQQQQQQQHHHPETTQQFSVSQKGSYQSEREKQQQQMQQYQHPWQSQHHNMPQQHLQQSHYQNMQQHPQQYHQPAQQQQFRSQAFQTASQNQDFVARDSVQQPAVAFKTPPSQKHRVNWPPPSPVQQNGRWNSPSPTPSSPSKQVVEAMWPPKQPTVRELPKTGFNPAVLREQGAGRRCVWPPPKPEDEFRSGRTTPQSPGTGRRITWNPSPSPPPVRRSPFGSASPVTRRKDIQWPPAQPTVQKVDVVQHRPSPTFTRKAKFDDYVKQHASSNVPSTYRPPPGTHRVAFRPSRCGKEFNLLFATSPRFSDFGGLFLRPASR